MAAVPKGMQGMLTKQSLLKCHGLLALRWCFLPLTVLLLSGSVLVACQLGGHYAAWSLAVLSADASMMSQDRKAPILLLLALALSAAALYCLPLMGLEAFAAMLVYLAAAASLASGAVACCRKPRQVSLQRVTFSAWAVAEAVMGVAVSAGLLYAASTLLADQRGKIEWQWLFFWRLLCINCAVSVLEFIMLPLLLLRLLREEKEVYCPPTMELQVIGACTDAEPLPGPGGPLRHFEPPRRLVRSLWMGSAAACVACMVLCTVVFLIFHIIPPGESLESIAGPGVKTEVCNSCFCENASPDVSVVHDIKYGRAFSERHGQFEDLLLDVYTPTVKKAKAPAVLLIHGGNFIGGSKNSGLMESEALYFARAGYVVFNMDYRLDGSTWLVELEAVRDAVHDAKAAVRFIVDHCESFGVDPMRIAAWGESAGGITAISMNSISSEGSSGSPGLASNVSAAVSLSGTMWPFLVAAPSNQVHRVTPWFNVHSKGDDIVFPFLAVMTHLYLLAKGVPEVENRLLWIPGTQHVPWTSSLSAVVRPVVLNFLSEVMKLKSICLD